MITRARFEAGQRIKLEELTGVIRFFEKDLAVVSFDGNAEPKTFIPSELYSSLRDNKLAFVADTGPEELYHPNLSEYQRKEMEKRYKYVIEMDKYDNPHSAAHKLLVIALVYTKDEGPKPPAMSTLSRWYKTWTKNKKDKFYLAPNIGGNRCTRPLKMTKLMDKIIKKEYLKLSKPSKASCYEKLEKAYNASDLPSLGIKIASPSTFGRYIDDWDRLDIIEKREGSSQARAEARSANKKIKLSRVLERVEADTGHFNIGLLSNNGKYYLGKPTIYFIFDAYSRALLGYSIEIRKGGESPSGAIHAMKHAMSIKLNSDVYPMYGVIETLVMDNGVGYRAQETQDYLSLAGVQRLDYVPTHSGWHKSCVERYIGSCRTMLFSNMDGYMGKYDPKKFKNDPLKKHAKYTVSQFLEAFEKFVIEYNKTEQDGLKGHTPLEMWENSAEEYPPLALVHTNALDMLIGEVHTKKKLSHVTGIKVGKQRFNSDELQAIYHEFKPAHSKEQSIDIDFLADWSDASFIKVQHPTKPVIFEVPNVDDESVGKSFAEATCEHKNNLVSTVEITDSTLSSHIPVLSPLQAQKSLITEVQKRGENVPELALGETPDFHVFMAQSPCVDNEQEPEQTEAPEQPNPSEMPSTEDVETEESDY